MINVGHGLPDQWMIPEWEKIFLRPELSYRLLLNLIQLGFSTFNFPSAVKTGRCIFFSFSNVYAGSTTT